MTLQDLKQCRAARYEIESMKERIERLRSAMESCTAKPIGAAGGSIGGQPDKLGEQFARLEQWQVQLADKLLQCESLASHAEQFFATLPPQQAIILRLRYVDGLSWRQLAKRSGYCLDNCFKLHKKALDTISP